MASIELDNISKRFGDTVAVHDTSLEIRDGEFFILVGPSGCGKSTLLNIIVGLEQPSEGNLYVDGTRVNEIDPKDRNMAMVFQSYAIYPHMSVRENLAFPLKLAKLSQQGINERVEKVAELLELTELLERRPANLSGGQRQRVAMGRAIVREPAVFLMDEPLSNLDTKLRMQMRTQISKLQQRLGTTTVYVTHDQTEAMTLGDHVAIMRHGAIEQIGTPRELYMEPATTFVADFIGAPSMNLVSARVKAGRLCLPMVELPLPKQFQNRELPASVVVGLRPEHLFEVNSPQAQDYPTHFEAEIDLCEWLGTESIVYFQVRDPEPATLARLIDAAAPATTSHQWAARLGESTSAVEGEKLMLGLDPEQIQLFDAGNGKRIPA